MVRPPSNPLLYSSTKAINLTFYFKIVLIFLKKRATQLFLLLLYFLKNNIYCYGWYSCNIKIITWTYIQTHYTANILCVHMRIFLHTYKNILKIQKHTKKLNFLNIYILYIYNIYIFQPTNKYTYIYSQMPWHSAIYTSSNQRLYNEKTLKTKNIQLTLFLQNNTILL
jgi:hypothetical protein